MLVFFPCPALVLLRPIRNLARFAHRLDSPCYLSVIEQ